MSRPMRLPTPLLHRKPDTHKGDFGHIFILAGSSRYSGAALLCSETSLRSGAGLVTLGIPKGINQAIIKRKLNEVMTLPLPETKEGSLSLSADTPIKKFIKDIDVMVLGPGLGQHRQTQSLIRKVVSVTDKPIVIDADGLNALVGHLNLLRITDNTLHITRIITPHPGEMSRLLGIGIKDVQSKRIKVAKELARDYNVTVVLKGHNTAVADKTGNLYVNKTGNPGMSTAGSGDVLTGMIAAFLGQGLAAFEAAKYAVYLHGLAGDLAAEEKTQIGMIASDIIAKIPQAIKKCS